MAVNIPRWGISPLGNGGVYHGRDHRALNLLGEKT